MSILKCNNNVTAAGPFEQIYINKELIAKHYEIDRALANLGIKVVGQVSTEAELPNPATYTGDYGDAYAVGDKDAVIAGTATYDYYVYTRPDPDAGEPYNYWLNVGKISIQGPVGPAPILSNDGTYITATNPNTGATNNVISIAELTPEATKWYARNSVPSDNTGFQEGDMLIIRGDSRIAGSVYHFDGTNWSYVTDLTGPQGNTGPVGPAPELFEDGGAYLKARDPQTGREYNVLPLSRIRGQRGEQGQPGKFISVVGILTDANQLPSPTTLNDLNAGYLIGSTSPYELYIQVGTNVNNAVWTNLGTFSVGTTVTVNGEVISTFDADTKLTAPPSTAGFTRIPAIGAGTLDTNSFYDAMLPSYFDTEANANRRNGVPIYVNGQLGAATPTSDYQAANKKYVDDIAVTKLDANTTTAGNRVYISKTVAGGTIVQDTQAYANTAIGSTFTLRTSRGTVQSSSDNITEDNDCVTKKYLETIIAQLKADNNLT